ncbi:hypothetical protein KKA15_05670 [Patescibacteria group bacterium]|nr:hypothetical protein [Patescibacteria group bacterium]
MIDEQLKEIIEKEIKSLSGNFEPDHKLTLIKVTNNGVVKVRITGRDSLSKFSVEKLFIQPIKGIFPNDITDVTIVT